MLEMLKNNFTERKAIGLSVNTTHLSYVVISEKQREFMLLDQGAVRIEETELVLQSLKSSFDFPCYLALPHQFIMSKTLQFSENFKENEIIELLTLNAEHYFSYPQEAICFDF